MSPGSFDYGRRRSSESKRSDNVLRSTADATPLACGHVAKGQPIATTFGRKLYWCEGCRALKERKR